MKQLVAGLSMAAFMLAGGMLAGGVATAKDYDRYYFFGDSLSDDGNLKSVTGPVNGPGTALPVVGVEDPEAYPSPNDPAVYGTGGVSNGPVWSRYIAPDHVLVGPVAPLTANTTDSFNFAWAGAAADATNLLAPVPDGRLQASQFANPLFVDPATIDRAVGSVWLGGNDLLNQIDREDNLAAGTQNLNALIPIFESTGFAPGAQDRINAAMVTASQAVGDVVQTLVDQGLKTIVVNNMPNLARTPRFLIAEPHLQQAAREGTTALNSAISAEVSAVRAAAPDDMQIIEIDTFEVLNFVLDNPSAFGFSNSTEQCLEADPCRTGTPEEAAEYVFWDGIHPTTRTHALMAGLVSDVLNVGFVRGASVRLGADISRAMSMRNLNQIGNRLANRGGINQRALSGSRLQQAVAQLDQPALNMNALNMNANVGPLMVNQTSPNLFISFDGGFSQLDEIGYSDLSASGTRGAASGADIADYAVTGGLDGMIARDLTVGMAVSYGWGNAESDDKTDVDLSSVSFMVYGGWQPAWFRAALGVGIQTDSYDIDRMTGAGVRSNGETDGFSVLAYGSLGADVRTGLWHVLPELRLDFTDLEIDGYTETGGPSLSLSYSDQSVQYLVAGMSLSAARDFVRQGADGAYYNAGRLNFGLGYELDLTGTDRTVTIENNSVMGAAPVLIAIDDRDRRAVTGHISGAFALTDVTQLELGYRGSVSTSDVQDDAHWFSARLSFALGAINPRATHW